MRDRTVRSAQQALVMLFAVGVCFMLLPGCGGGEQGDDGLSFDVQDNNPPATTTNGTGSGSDAPAQPEPEQELGPEPIRLTRFELQDPAKLMAVAEQCFPRLSPTQANWGVEMVALAIAYRYMGQPDQYQAAVERALDRLGTRSPYFARRALKMLGKAGCFDAIELYRVKVQDDAKMNKMVMSIMFESLPRIDAAAYPALLEWLWVRADETGKSSCWAVAEQQIRLGAIDDAMKRLGESKGRDYLRDDEIVRAIAVLAGQPDRAVPIAESLHNANGKRDQGRVWLVHGYTLIGEFDKAAEQIELIEGSPYRATARIVRQRVERSLGARTTEDGEKLAVQLLPEIASPFGEPRNHLSYERAMLKSMLLDELMIHGREDLARPYFEERGIFGEDRVNTTTLENAMGLYFRNNHPEVARGLLERLEDGSKFNKYQYLFIAFCSDRFLNQTDLINVRPYLDEVFLEHERPQPGMAMNLRPVAYAIHQAGLGDHEAWLSFVEQLDKEMYVMAVAIGTLESRLNMPGPRIQEIPWTGYPMPRR